MLLLKPYAGLSNPHSTARNHTAQARALKESSDAYTAAKGRFSVPFRAPVLRECCIFSRPTISHDLTSDLESWPKMLDTGEVGNSETKEYVWLGSSPQPMTVPHCHRLGAVAKVLSITRIWIQSQ